MTDVYHNKQSVLDAVRSWLTVILTTGDAATDYPWFDADSGVLDEPANAPATVDNYFTLQALSVGRRSSAGRQAMMDGTPTDFTDDPVMVQAFGEDAVNALSYALFIWNTDDAIDMRASLATSGFQVIVDDSEVSPMNFFLETSYDVRGMQIVRAGCRRELTRVTPNARTIEVSGVVDDDLDVSVAATVETP